MKRTLACIAFTLLIAAAAPALALELKGSDELAAMTQQVLSTCSGTNTLSYSGGGNALGEQAMLGASQQVAPLSARFLDVSRTCSSTHPEDADGLLIALDAITAVADLESAQACGNRVAISRSVTVSEQNGTPGLQCAGCVGSTYTLTGWRDVMRIILTGMPEGVGSDVTQRDCNSDLRRTLASNYQNLFEDTCSGSSCVELKHVFRAGESVDSTEVLLSLLSLPDPASLPFCNVHRSTDTWPALSFPPSQPPNDPPYSAEYQDNDPIRSICVGTGNLPGPPTGIVGDPPPNEPTEQVCSARGDLGLVLPIVPPRVHVPEAPQPYTVTNCAKGKFRFGPAPKLPTDFSVFPPKVRFERCPNGDVSILGGQCLLPIDLLSNTRCNNGKNNAPSFHISPDVPGSVDGRVYNLHLRRDDAGNYATDGLGRQVVGAFYRIHSTRSLNVPATSATCTEPDPTRAIGCLTQASPCSFGLAAKRAGQYLGTKNLLVNGTDPTQTNIQRVLTDPPDPLTYPLSLKMYFTGMGGVDKAPDFSQWLLGQCMMNRTKVENAANIVGLIPLGTDPMCVDFDERQCGTTLLNSNACQAGIDICPKIGIFAVAPLQTNIGGHIGVSATGSDADSDPLTFLWTATTGTFADQFASSTTYTCTDVGVQTITLSLWDGSCIKQKTIDVTCVP